MAENDVTHGLARKGNHHPLYDVWEKIKSRCYTPGSTHYARYGGRGVTMCDKWHYDAEIFVAWCLLTTGRRKSRLTAP